MRHPESLDVDPATGEVYVGTFDARMPESARNNQVLRFAADGRLLSPASPSRRRSPAIAFRDGQVYVLNFGASKLQRLPTRFDADSAIEDVATFFTLSPPAPPARRIDKSRWQPRHDHLRLARLWPSTVWCSIAPALYVSDSFQGAVYRIANGDLPSVQGGRVRARSAAGDDRRIAVRREQHGLQRRPVHPLHQQRRRRPRPAQAHALTAAIGALADSVYGADGLLFHEGLLWVSANQIDTLVALDERRDPPSLPAGAVRIPQK